MKNLVILVSFFLFFGSILYSPVVKSQVFNNCDGGNGGVFNSNTRIKCLVDEMIAGRDSNTQKIKNSIDTFIIFADRSIPNASAVDAFVANDCAGFRNDLELFIQGMNATTNALLAFNDLLNPPEVIDPGLANYVVNIPCKFMYPSWKIIDGLDLFNPDLLQSLDEIPEYLNELKLIVFPPESEFAISSFSIEGGVFDTNSPTIANSCERISANDQLINIASKAISSTAAVSTAAGTILEAVGKSGLTGPKEAHVAAWGWAGGTIEHNSKAMVGKFLNGVGSVLFAATGAVSRKRSFCALYDVNIELKTELAALRAIVEGGQLELLNGQAEIIRLLLTPQGRRDSGESSWPESISAVPTARPQNIND